MRHELRRLLDAGDRAEPCVRGLEFLRAETQAVHAGVEFQPGSQRRPPRIALEQSELLEAVHHQVETLLSGLRELLGHADAFEQQHALVEACVAQHESFLETGDREGIARRERAGDRHQAVPVCVRLDDREDAAIRRERTDAREIVAQRRRIHDRANVDPGRDRHGSWP